MTSTILRSKDPPGALSWSALLLRVVSGLMIFSIHGWHKFAGGWAQLRRDVPWPLAQEVAAMHLPTPLAFAWTATLIQFVCAPLLFLGWRTRLNACLLAATLAVAIVQNVTTGSDPELAILYVVILATIVLIGGGQFSVDARIARGEGLR